MPTSNLASSPTPGLWRKTALAVAMLLAAAGCGKVDLYSDVPEKEANMMMAALLEEGIECTKEAGDEDHTWKLQVGIDQFSRSVNVLNDMGFPMDKRQSIGQVFKGGGLVSSPTEDRIRYVYALSEELAETVSRIDGVVDARVHVVLPNNDPYAEKVKPSSAAVFIKYRSDIEPTASQNQVKDLVAKSIEGLQPENVEVFMDVLQPSLLPADRKVQLSRIFGIQVVDSSADKLWMLIVGLIVAVSINVLVAIAYTFRQSLGEFFHSFRFGGDKRPSEPAAA